MNSIKFDETVTLKVINSNDAESTFSLQVNPKSFVFQGHFPDQPILPGVLMVAAVKRGLNEKYSGKWSMESSSAIKYLGVITPRKDQNLILTIKHAQINPEQIKIDTQIRDENTTKFKMKATYKTG